MDINFGQTKTYACCFTGHRILAENEVAPIKESLVWIINLLVDKGVEIFISGGANGFDALAAATVFVLKKKFPSLRLIMVLPYFKQGLWSEIADEIIYVSEHYDSGCFLKRNRFLVEHSAFCVCYLNKTSGGTAYTVEYARKKGVQVINLATPNPLSASGLNV